MNPIQFTVENQPYTFTFNRSEPVSGKDYEIEYWESESFDAPITYTLFGLSAKGDHVPESVLLGFEAARSGIEIEKQLANPNSTVSKAKDGESFSM